MLAWLSANWINLILIAVLTLTVALLIRGMVRDRKAGKRSCGGNCASCGGCSGCSSCKSNAATMNNRTHSVSGKVKPSCASRLGSCLALAGSGTGAALNGSSGADASGSGSDGGEGLLRFTFTIN